MDPIYIVVIYFLHPLLGHVALAGAIGLFILAVCSDLLTRGPLEKATIAGQRSNRVVSSAVRNAELVDALGLVSGVLRRWAGESGEALRLQSVAGDRAAAIQGLSKFVRLFVQIAIIAVGAYLIIGQSLTGSNDSRFAYHGARTGSSRASVRNMEAGRKRAPDPTAADGLLLS